MELITFVIFLTCQKAQLVNDSNESWTKQDEQAIQKAIKSCATDESNINTPCLKSFYKKQPKTYETLCTKAIKRSW